MKSKIFFLMTAFTGLFLLQGCEDDLLDVTESFTYETELVVSSNDLTYTASELIDLSADVDLINQYGDKIKDIEIEELKYWLTAFVGSAEQKIVNATVVIADENGNDPKTIASVTDQLLQPLLNNQTDLTLNQEGVDKLADLIQNPPHKFNLTFTTTSNEVPLDFTVKFKFTIKMTANPL
ncbi:MAG: hypothetical protein IH598_14215 [Bacteroidales bacterium]|nr:hypothetical protein [Bacteroidales bacterium]